MHRLARKLVIVSALSVAVLSPGALRAQWFENKKAVLNWYYSEGHQQLIKTFASGGYAGRKPLADIPDDQGPIMAIASLTLSDKPQVAGGLAAGGRFAPATVKVKGLIETPLAAAK